MADKPKPKHLPNNPKHKRAALGNFGLFLRQRRESLRLSQAEAAASLTEAIKKNAGGASANSVSQSLIAQLEAGTNRNPDESLLRGLPDVYGVSYESVICELVKDKYGLDELRANRLKDDVRDVTELAEWELRVKPRELWIVAPNFVDDTVGEINRAVQTLLIGKTEITYFVNEADATESGRFTIYKASMIEQIKESTDMDAGEISKRLNFHPLRPDQLAWLATSFVIADPKKALVTSLPNEGRASGYYVFPSETGKPSYGVGINQSELGRLVFALTNVIRQEKRDKKTSTISRSVTNETV